MTHYVMRPADDPERYPGFQPDFSVEVGLADDASALVDHLDVKLTAGQTSDAVKTSIVELISGMTVEGDDMDEDRKKRVQTAILMMMASGAYAVQN